MKDLTLAELEKLIMEQAKKKGWGIKPEKIDTFGKLALIHSEVSEAVEAWRKKKINGKDGLAEELGDVLMRAIHLAGIYNINLEKEILKKLKKNNKRDWRKYYKTHVQ